MEKPKITKEELLSKISGIDRIKYPMIVIGIRGYYKGTENEVGVYDDAIFIDTPNVFAAFNGNVDPSKEREGMANLMPGIYYAHCFGMHKGEYLALVQHKGDVTVNRWHKDEKTGVVSGKLDKGYFGINIHKGGINTTSSEGCQTLHGAQWPTFIALAVGEAKRIFGAAQYDKETIPYILLDFTEPAKEEFI